MRRSRVLAAAAVLACALPGAARAQAGSCDILEAHSWTQTTQGGAAVVVIQGPLRVVCAGGAEIRANEANLFQASSEVHLFGNVRFTDPEREMTANTAVYSSRQGLLHATGDVVFTDRIESATLRGPDVEYYRVIPGRTEPQVVATQRPRLTLTPEARPGAEPSAPMHVDADRITIVGQDLSASGSVVIDSRELSGSSAEARYARTAGQLELRGQARLVGERFALSGEEIDARVPNQVIEYVEARRAAQLTGEEITVDAPELRIFFADSVLQRLVARRTAPTDAQPVAVATGFRLSADSLDALTPGQQLEQVIAIGTARAEAIDTTQAATPSATPANSTARLAGAIQTDRDWVTGDTVIGYFEPDTAAARAQAADTTARPAPERQAEPVQIERLVARGAARSLYRVRNEGEAPAPRPALNYLSGELIELRFSNGELAIADVEGLQQGVYLDPNPEPAAPPEGETAPAPAAPAPTTTAARRSR
jgi:lipopolysaccharide export system protein LptA